MYEKIRGEVPTLFFSSNYFGLPLENQNGSEINYATPSSTATIVNEYEYSPKYRVVKGNSVKVKEISKEPQL
jgi:hypothetical protein